MKTRYVTLLILLAFIFVFLLPEMPHGHSEPPVNLTENETYPVPLMSPQDDVFSDDTDQGPGWWKHTGNSYVTYGSNKPETSSSEENNGEMPDPEEIPEFPTVAIPVLVVMGLAFMFQKS